MGKKEVKDFTERARNYLDTVYYPKHFSKFMRVDDKARYKARDFINIKARSNKDGGIITVQEKIVHCRGDYTVYFEIEHVNDNGGKSPGIGLQSKANVFLAVFWDDELNAPLKIYAFDARKLRALAREVAVDKEKRDKFCHTVKGGTTGAGVRFEVTSMKFLAAELPETYLLCED